MPVTIVIPSDPEPKVNYDKMDDSALASSIRACVDDLNSMLSALRRRGGHAYLAGKELEAGDKLPKSLTINREIKL